MVPQPPDDIVAAWFEPGSVRLTRLSGGLINGTWRVDGSGPTPRGVLQWVNGVVAKPPVNDDLDRVSQHLTAKGVPTPQLIPTRDGRRWLPTGADDSWRLLTWLPGDCHASLPSHDHARSGAALVGRWHAATTGRPAGCLPRRRGGGRSQRPHAHGRRHPPHPPGGHHMARRILSPLMVRFPFRFAAPPDPVETDARAPTRGTG